MNLIIEQGNTATKAAVCNGRAIVNSSVYKNYNISGLFSWIKQYPLENGIFSTVSTLDHSLIAYLTGELKYFLFLDEQTELPVSVRYQTPATLGKDRVAAAVGAHFLHPETNVLVIDAGTAITYDVVEASGVYIGGNISPGMTTRFRALSQFTERLPLVQETDDIPLLGSSTETAIQAGVVNGIVYEMDSYINELRIKYPDLFVFLTGGHSFYFERRLKNSIFAAINLVLIGLNRILEYNVENKENRIHF